MGLNRQRNGVSAQAITIGIGFVCLMTFMSRYIDLTFMSGNVGSSAPAPAPVYILFFWLLIITPILRLVSRKLVLSRKEILVIYAMMVAAGTISSHEVVGFMLPHMASVHYNATPENEWASLFHKYLPSWIGPPAKESLMFADGEDLLVPWRAWALPIASWSFFLLTLFFVMLCINTVLTRQWMYHERLAFPLVAIPLELTSVSKPTSYFPDIFRNRMFWLGISIPLFLKGLNTLHTFFPTVPAMPLSHLTIWNQPASRPWSGLGRLEWNFWFWLTGIAFIVPTDISLSCWVFHMITRLENVIAVIWKGHSGPPSVYSPMFPALFYQGMGALLGLFLIAIWTGRAHWILVLKSTFTAGKPSSESYRFFVIAGIIGFIVLCGWCVAAGMSPVTAFTFMSIFLVIAFVLARIRTETGLGILMSPLIVSETLYTFRGTAAFRAEELTVIASLRWSYFAKGTMGVMPGQLEGLKLADTLKMDKKKLGIAMYAAIFITLFLSIYLALTLFYDKGFTELPIGDSSTHYIASQAYWAYQNLSVHLNNPGTADMGGITAIMTGLAVCLSLATLRFRLLWWHLHPVGYIAANSWGMHVYWSPFFMGWLAKTALLRYGGLRYYRSALPVFIGLIVGDILHQGIASVVGWIIG
ncbi:DUF6785 family protein [Candidatus Poribacteria bacterium]